jgi:hypothetical protein
MNRSASTSSAMVSASRASVKVSSATSGFGSVVVRAAFSSSRVPPAARKSSAPLTGLPLISAGTVKYQTFFVSPGLQPAAESDHGAQDIGVGAGVGVEADHDVAALEEHVFPVA